MARNYVKAKRAENQAETRQRIVQATHLEHLVLEGPRRVGGRGEVQPGVQEVAPAVQQPELVNGAVAVERRCSGRPLTGAFVTPRRLSLQFTPGCGRRW